jgi:pyruvate ferredoxin oxidoreductase gamma subunit
MIEVRWHGRGGQGAKTAALLFADAVLATGKYVQGFPEYGPERMGAPVQSFNRIDDNPITLHCGVTAPNVVVVLDPTLMDSLDLTQGIPANGAIIINTKSSPAEMRAKTGMKSGKVYTVDATTISRECIGLEKPNTPMMGALVKVIGSQGLKLDLNEVVGDTEQKFAHKPEVIKGNLDCLRRAYNETKGE